MKDDLYLGGEELDEDNLMEKDFTKYLKSLINRFFGGKK